MNKYIALGGALGLGILGAGLYFDPNRPIEAYQNSEHLVGYNTEVVTDFVDDIFDRQWDRVGVDLSRLSLEMDSTPISKVRRHHEKEWKMTNIREAVGGNGGLLVLIGSLGALAAGVAGARKFW